MSDETTIARKGEAPAERRDLEDAPDAAERIEEEPDAAPTSEPSSLPHARRSGRFFHDEIPTAPRVNRDGARAVTEPVSRIRQRIMRDAELYPETFARPRKRGDCVDGPRPCPFVGCKYHLAIDVSPRNGHIKFNFPDLQVDELGETCALDVADRGGATLDEVGELLNIGKERARQIELGAAPRLRLALQVYR